MAESRNAKELIARLRKFHSQAEAERRENARVRRDAVGLLTPALLRSHIRSGQDLVLAYGRHGLTVTYTPADLLHFKHMIERTQAGRASHIRGMAYGALWKASLPVDIQRSKQVKNATFYRIDGDTMHFRVSGNSKPFYRVRIRMEQWNELMKSADGSWDKSVKQAMFGRLSIDCACGRHQFWYRYLAGIGNYAVTPPAEQDYPKIRNPRLTGCCCKHVLKVLQVMKGIGIERILAKEMAKQAATVGYGGTARAHQLSVEDVKASQRAKGTKRDPREVRKALEEFKATANAMLLKAKGKPAVQKIRGKIKPRKTVQQKIRQTRTPQERQMLADAVSQALKLRRFNIDVSGTLKEIQRQFSASDEEMKDALKQAEKG